MTEQRQSGECTARMPNGTYDDPGSCSCDSCVAWQEARQEAWDRAEAAAEQTLGY